MKIQILKIAAINKKYLFIVLILFCVCILLYSNVLFNGFTMDDHYLITENSLIRNLKFLPNIFQRTVYGEGCFYRPLAIIFAMTEYYFFKLNPLGYHLVNILFHFLIGLSFFIIINLLFNNFLLSLLTSLLFIVHPIHNTVINPSASDVILASIFMVFSLLTFIKFSLTDKYKFYYFSITFFIIALFIRETSILLPFYLLSIVLFLESSSIKKYAYLILPFFILSITYFIFRLFFFSLKIGILNEFTTTLTISNYISGFLRLVLIYLRLVVIPKGIVWILSIPIKEGIFNIEIIAFILIFLVVLYIAIKYWKRNINSFGLLWFSIGVFPALSMISSRPSFWLSIEPHWFYFSVIGLFLFISIFLVKLKKYINSKLWFCLIFSILLFYGNQARAYNYLWKSPKIYYKYWLKESPNNIARFNLAYIYSSDGEYDKAESLYKETLTNSFFKKGNSILFSTSEVSLLYSNLGALYYQQGRLDEAMKMLDKAIEINPNNSRAYLSQSTIFLKNNQWEKAIMNYEKVREKDPYNLMAHYYLAILYATLGNEEKALEAYFRAVDLDKDCFKIN